MGVSEGVYTSKALLPCITNQKDFAMRQLPCMGWTFCLLSLPVLTYKGLVSAVYSNLYSKAASPTEDQMVTIKYANGLYNMSMKAYSTCYTVDSDTDSDSEVFTAYHIFVPGHDFDTHLMFKDRHMIELTGCNKQTVHRVLCHAPFGMVEEFSGSRLLLESKYGCSTEDLCRCARFGFDLLCQCKWDCAWLQIVFPGEVGETSIAYTHAPFVCHIQRGLKIKCTANPHIDFPPAWNAIDTWVLDNVEVNGMVKLDFDNFPASAIGVMVMVESSYRMFERPVRRYITGQPHLEYLQDCLAFAYTQNFDMNGFDRDGTSELDLASMRSMLDSE